MLRMILMLLLKTLTCISTFQHREQRKSKKWDITKWLFLGWLLIIDWLNFDMFTNLSKWWYHAHELCSRIMFINYNHQLCSSIMFTNYVHQLRSLIMFTNYVHQYIKMLIRPLTNLWSNQNCSTQRLVVIIWFLKFWKVQRSQNYQGIHKPALSKFERMSNINHMRSNISLIISSTNHINQLAQLYRFIDQHQHQH